MGKPHHQRMEEIVQAALDLAAEQGAGRVTTQAIADRVGIAQPTVFRHFRSRDEIFEAAIAWIAEHQMDALGSCFESDDPPAARLRCLISRQLDFVNRQKGIPRLLFSDRLHLDSPELKASVRKVMDRYVSLVTGLVEEGDRRGEFSPVVPAGEPARYIAALIQRLLMRWSVYDLSFDLTEHEEGLWRLVSAALGSDSPVGEGSGER